MFFIYVFSLIFYKIFDSFDTEYHNVYSGVRNDRCQTNKQKPYGHDCRNQGNFKLEREEK